MAARPTESPVLFEVEQTPDDHFERRARKRGAARVVGVDEAGRGPLAGPVVCAAVCFEAGKRVPRGLNDSKRLTPAERERLYGKIIATAAVSVVVASHARVDAMNILRASLWGMSRAVAALTGGADHVLVDGNMLPPDLPCPAEALIGGDGRSVSIAAASIVAKVTRDRLMKVAGAAYPLYGFENHMGYSTPEHLAALTEHGPCVLHRRSFAPVRVALGLEVAVETEMLPGFAA